MKIQFLTIAALALATSTVSAFSCPRDPTEIIQSACMSNWLDAALCNCNAFATIASGSCFVKCTVTKPQPTCQSACAGKLGKETVSCQKKYDNYKKNGGGLDWINEMQVKKGGWC